MRSNILVILISMHGINLLEICPSSKSQGFWWLNHYSLQSQNDLMFNHSHIFSFLWQVNQVVYWAYLQQQGWGAIHSWMIKGSCFTAKSTLESLKSNRGCIQRKSPLWSPEKIFLLFYIFHKCCLKSRIISINF